MHIWTVKLEERWSNDKHFSAINEYTVSAKNYDQALAKADKVAKKQSFVDDEFGGTGKRYTVVETRIISISRGRELDA